jgi:hypothetical protein
MTIAEAPFGLLPIPAVRSHPTERFRGNTIEQQLLSGWMEQQNLGWDDIRASVREYYIKRHEGLGVGGWNICTLCSTNDFEMNLMSWWIETKEKPESNYRDPRPKCWYGWECRTQTHNQSHARRLAMEPSGLQRKTCMLTCNRMNHTCNPTPPDQRRQTAPPRTPTPPALPSRPSAPPVASAPPVPAAPPAAPAQTVSPEPPATSAPPRSSEPAADPEPQTPRTPQFADDSE